MKFFVKIYLRHAPSFFLSGWWAETDWSSYAEGTVFILRLYSRSDDTNSEASTWIPLDNVAFIERVEEPKEEL